MSTRPASTAELDDDELPPPRDMSAPGRKGRPPIRKTGRGLSYSQGRPHKPAPSSQPPSPAPGDILYQRSTGEYREIAPTTTPTAPNPGGASSPAPATSSPPASAQPGRPPAPARGNAGARPGAALAGLVTGLFLWGYAINWLRGGIVQANGWLGAKFLNEPYKGGK